MDNNYIKVFYSNIKYHKVGYQYEFRNKNGNDLVGIIISVEIKIELLQQNTNEIWESIIYKVKSEDDYYFVEHETNTELK